MSETRMTDSGTSETGTSQSETTSPRDDWNGLLDLFGAGRLRRAMKWSFGFSPRLSRRRIAHLQDTGGAVAVSTLLARRDAACIKALRTYAAVNHEQAAAALRITAIVNVSIPVIVLTLATQMSDGAFWADIMSVYSATPLGWVVPVALLSGLLLATSILLGSGAARLGEARDLRHLIELHAAERGIYFGLEDEDDMPS
ncbi:hypothetical protein [uncultured Algimonas sp.]|uniref:hypothetical protein n=1 Tax=uncultured Algimonas sp. TaxID=1547920 RepID=UPI00263771AF|nr:hypothetical protein [uncultured Algimonas sp.]